MVATKRREKRLEVCAEREAGIRVPGRVVPDACPFRMSSGTLVDREAPNESSVEPALNSLDLTARLLDGAITLGALRNSVDLLPL